MRKSAHLYTLGLCLLAPLTAPADGDLQSWNTLTLVAYQDAAWKAQVFGENRYAGDVFLASWLVGPKVFYQANDHLELALGGTYQEVRSSEDADFNSVFRFEPEANLQLDLGSSFALDVRNRLEVRLTEVVGDGANVRYRARPRFSWKPDGLGPLRSLAVANEVFWSFEGDYFAENRFFPVMASFALFDGASLGSYFMLRTRRGDPNADWGTDYLIGLNLTVNLPTVLSD